MISTQSRDQALELNNAIKVIGTNVLHFDLTNKDAFTEYVKCTVKGGEATFRGLRFLKTNEIQCIIHLDELEISGIVVVSNALVEVQNVDDWEPDFLKRLLEIKNISAVKIPPDFMRVRNMRDVLEFCADSSCYVVLEGVHEDEIDVAEFTWDEAKKELLGREIGADGTVDENWSNVNSGYTIAVATLFGVYSRNLQHFATNVVPEKLEIIF
jgi:hypothetical protein